eukprot:1192106-Prorocentrum_minimum.AAC.5
MGGLSKHAAHLFKRAQRGLFAGRMITFGNRVSDCGGNEYKCVPLFNRKSPANPERVLLVSGNTLLLCGWPDWIPNSHTVG